jgi:long-chain fatty acid transport protein
MRKQAFILGIAAAAGLLLGAPAARANGFYIQEMSASGLGQGMALVAGNGRPTSQYHNVSALSYMKGGFVEFSGTTYTFVGGYENTAGVKTAPTTAPIFVPHFFASYKVNDWLAVGLSEFTNFGLKVRWPSNWEGRTVAIESGMETFTINPNISFGPFKGFAVGVGFNAMHGSFRILRGLALGQNPSGQSSVPNTVDLQGSAWGYGANVGLMYQPADWVRFGVSYRSGIKIAATNGTVDFNVSSPFGSRFPDQHFKASIQLPHVVLGGVRFWPKKNLSLELDAQWVQWSSYDRLRFELDKGLALGPAAKQMVLEEQKNYKDAIQLRVGMDWEIIDKYLSLRLGFLWDQNPVPDKSVDPALPDTERVMPCISLGTQVAGFYFDVAYMPVFGLKRTVTLAQGAPLEGTYTSVIHDFSFTVGYHWDTVKR